MTRVVSVVGNSKTGKTTLLSQLVHLLKERGYTVCVVKHSSMKLSYRDFDHEGKDTCSFSEAGADEVWLTSPSLTYHMKSEETSLDEIIRNTKADFILVEGFREAETKKIVIKEKGEEIDVKGVIHTIEGEYDPEEILDIILYS